MTAEAIGRNPDQLSLDEQTALRGKWIALEIYTPDALPLRRIEAVGDSAAQCARTLKGRGLDPKRFEYSRLKGPF